MQKEPTNKAQYPTNALPEAPKAFNGKTTPPGDFNRKIPGFSLSFAENIKDGMP